MKNRKTDKELEKYEEGRDVWQETIDAVDEIKAGGGRRRTLAPSTQVARVRYKLGLSQMQFANLIGVSKRTIEQWEQGRREPSGAARMLISIADKRPEVLNELASA